MKEKKSKLEQKYWKEQANWEHEMEMLCKKAQLICDHDHKGKEISMIKLREWVLLEGELPQHTYERTPLECALEVVGVEHLIKENEYE